MRVVVELKVRLEVSDTRWRDGDTRIQEVMDALGDFDGKGVIDWWLLDDGIQEVRTIETDQTR